MTRLSIALHALTLFLIGAAFAAGVIHAFTADMGTSPWGLVCIGLFGLAVKP